MLISLSESIKALLLGVTNAELTKTNTSFLASDSYLYHGLYFNSFNTWSNECHETSCLSDHSFSLLLVKLTGLSYVDSGSRSGAFLMLLVLILVSLTLFFFLFFLSFLESLLLLERWEIDNNSGPWALGLSTWGSFMVLSWFLATVELAG